jgi:hypothetical protein
MPDNCCEQSDCTVWWLMKMVSFIAHFRISCQVAHVNQLEFIKSWTWLQKFYMITISFDHPTSIYIVQHNHRKTTMKITLWTAICLIGFAMTGYAGDIDSEIQKTIHHMQQRYLDKRGYTTIAIKQFKILGVEKNQFDIASQVIRKLQCSLTELGYCEVLDVNMFNASLRNLRETQVVRSKDYFSLGQKIGANAIIDGVVFNNGLVHIFINDVRTGKQVFADNIVLSSAEIPSRNAVLRSLVCPGWGQLSFGQPRKGLIIMSAEASLAATAIAMGIANRQATQQFLRATTDQERELFGTKIDKTHSIHYLAICSILALWAYNVLDAYAMVPQGVMPDENPPPNKDPMDIAGIEPKILWGMHYQFALH